MNDKAPISHPIAVSEVPPLGTVVRLAASEDERAKLADYLGVEAVKRFEARLEVKPWAREGLDVAGEVEADVTQICGVTLDPFDSTLTAGIEARFTPAEGAVRAGRQNEPQDDEEIGEGADLDAPDPLVNGTVDLGSVAAEFLALAVDPYPRKPGVSFQDHVEDSGPETNRPFGDLARLMDTKHKNRS